MSRLKRTKPNGSATSADGLLYVVQEDVQNQSPRLTGGRTKFDLPCGKRGIFVYIRPTRGATTHMLCSRFSFSFLLFFRLFNSKLPGQSPITEDTDLGNTAVVLRGCGHACRLWNHRQVPSPPPPPKSNNGRGDRMHET